MTTYKNIFVCECGNHDFFIALEKCNKENTNDTFCSYCSLRTSMNFVKSIEVKA